MRALVLASIIVAGVVGFSHRASGCVAAGAEKASSGARTDTAGSSSLSFGKTLECRLQTIFFRNEDRVLDLETGRVQSVPARIPMNGLNNPRPLFKWMVNAKTDLLISHHKPGELRLHLDDGLLAFVPSDYHFDSFTGARLGSFLSPTGSTQVLSIPWPQDVPGPLIAFRTREGGQGVLQVLRCGVQPTSYVRVRYKMLQEQSR